MNAFLEVMILPPPNRIWSNAKVFRSFVPADSDGSKTAITHADVKTCKIVRITGLANVLSAAALPPHRQRLLIDYKKSSLIYPDKSLMSASLNKLA